MTEEEFQKLVDCLTMSKEDARKQSELFCLALEGVADLLRYGEHVQAWKTKKAWDSLD